MAQRVLVTGGTGFIGSHTVRALREGGHAVRLFVRSPEKARRLFGDGPDAPELAVGDVTDAEAVERALEGCDAVVHAAAVVAIEARRAREVRDTNLRGVECVLGGAVRRGIGPIVYVSSASALHDPRLRVVTPDAPVARARSAYSRSKADAERWVRARQDEGAPIACTYPTAVIGPDDPGLSEGNHTIMIFLRDVFVDTSSGFQITDVRDLARAHAKLVERGARPGRFAVSAPQLSWKEFGDRIEALTGRLRRLPMPGGVLRAAGAVADVVKRVVPFDFPLSTEAMRFATRWVPVDASRTEAELGVVARPVEESLEDTIRWLVRAGHLTPHRAGRLGA